jgi:uncharacterized phage-associated protein
MATKLEDVILYLVYHSPKSLTKTSLMKFIYLADYQHYRLYGEQLTDCVWEADQYGPVDYAILDTAWALGMSGKLLPAEGRTGYGDPMTQFVRHTDFKPSIELEERTVAILNGLLRKFGRWSAKRLADMCKLTEPFLVRPKIRQRLDMDLIKRTAALEEYPEIQRLRSRLARMDLSERGDPEEWAQHITEIYRSTAEARKRATTAGLQEYVDS